MKFSAEAKTTKNKITTIMHDKGHEGRLAP